MTPVQRALFEVADDGPDDLAAPDVALLARLTAGDAVVVRTTAMPRRSAGPSRRRGRARGIVTMSDNNGEMIGMDEIHDVDALGAVGTCTRCGAALIPGTTATGVGECAACLYGATSQPWDEDATDDQGDGGSRYAPGVIVDLDNPTSYII